MCVAVCSRGHRKLVHMVFLYLVNTYDAYAL